MGRGDQNHPLLAPLQFAAMVACVIAGFLALDHFADADEQLLLGAATWLILITSCACLGREDRARALMVVVVASCAEVLGSIVLGAYTYRLENLPAFVPPGHGLVFLAGLRISQIRAGTPAPARVPLGRDRAGRRLGCGGIAASRPDRRARGDHRSAADLRPAPRPRRDPVRRCLPDGRVPGDLRDLDRRLALGRNRAGHASARRATRRAASPASTSCSTSPRSRWRPVHWRHSTACAACRPHEPRTSPARSRDSPPASRRRNPPRSEAAAPPLPGTRSSSIEALLRRAQRGQCRGDVRGLRSNIVRPQLGQSGRPICALSSRASGSSGTPDPSGLLPCPLRGALCKGLADPEAIPADGAPQSLGAASLHARREERRCRLTARTG